MNVLVRMLVCAVLFGYLPAPVVATGGGERIACRAPCFTAAQAMRGRVLYESSCASCHGMDLIASDPSAASLTATEFRFAWPGRSVAERLATISDTMPPGDFDVLRTPDYLDIIAYILSFNGYPPGTEELPADMASLEAMTIGPAPLSE